MFERSFIWLFGLAIFVNYFSLERTNQLSLLPDKDLVDLCSPIEPYQVTKSPLFFADSFFVKKTERIETMLFLMSFCLLVYNLGQRELRNSLKRAKAGVKNQVSKLTSRPTMRWIFQCFQGIHIFIVNGVKQIVNLTEERRFI
ncbi:MAG: hypothetical protein EWV66_13580 [Microcystis sp. M_OC_Ca_00000000_C217Col]|nr:MAG: hypothetical protein EWV66_13580 [Microcystis sp. M_OC_Ca_00000000_C217Col]